MRSSAGIDDVELDPAGEPSDVTSDVTPAAERDAELGRRADNLVVIRPSGRFASLDSREIWRFRELLYFLAWRDVKVRYKQTAIGVGWAVLQPLGLVIVFSLVFNRLLHAPSRGVPYPLLVFVALLPWQLFASALGRASLSLVANEPLISKVYFPRIIIPAASVLAAVVDFLFALIILAGLMLWYGIAPPLEILLLPVLTALALFAALSVGILLAALNVRYRDVQAVLPFLTQLWLFATPIAYASTLVPDRYRLVYALNPMVGVVEGFRWAVLGTTVSPATLAVSAAVALTVFAIGVVYFSRSERDFADVI